MSVVAVDFDGVLHPDLSEWKNQYPPDSPISGAQEFVQSLLDLGLQVVIFTARANDPAVRWGIIVWLNVWGFPLVEVSATKPFAGIYIDDRGFRFDGSFEKALKFVSSVDNWRTWQD